MFEYVGALHIHSIFSDGSGEVKEIAQFAEESELDFIILTDHNTLRALNEGYEGWYGRTLLLVGFEINDKQNQNHLLALGLEETISTRIPAIEYTRKIKEMGGISFIAHPHEKRSSMKEHPPYPWTEWSSTDFTGIEIWNHMSEWMEGLTDQNKYNYFIHPLKSIISPSKETLEVWDKLNLERHVVGIGGVDAHAHKVNLLGFFELEVFPYKVLFKSIRTHILTKELIVPSTDEITLKETKAEVYSSLAEGRCFVSNYYHGDAKGFNFWAEDGNLSYSMGESVALTDKLRLVVKSPGNDLTIKLLHNGNVIETVAGCELIYSVKEKGAYRVEVLTNGNAWIFSNHIRIGL